jgi:hypothetical protein
MERLVDGSLMSSDQHGRGTTYNKISEEELHRVNEEVGKDDSYKHRGTSVRKPKNNLEDSSNFDNQQKMMEEGDYSKF